MGLVGLAFRNTPGSIVLPGWAPVWVLATSLTNSLSFELWERKAIRSCLRSACLAFLATTTSFTSTDGESLAA
jgi:hypothetical protein